MPRHRRLLFFLALALAPILLHAAADATEIRAVYRFERPAVAVDDAGWTTLRFPGAVDAGEAGSPAYPFRGVRLLLPAGETVASIRFERRDWRILPGAHRLRPRQHDVPGVDADRGGRLFVNETAYRVDRRVHPPEGTFRTHYLRGHPIAVGSFCPVGYRPATGEVGWFAEVTVVVGTAADPHAAEAGALRRDDDETIARLTGIVDNPGDAPPPLGLPASPWEPYEYLIVTTENLADDFAPLAEFHARRGLRSKIMTLQTIHATYDGDDDAERIRAAIADQYATRGVTHVLLGGDGDGPPGGAEAVIPYRGFYCGVESATLYEEENIPADMYYSNLDGTWNADGDSLWGEPGEDDLFAELAVGRACVQTAADVANFIDKTTRYLESPVAGEVESALLLGEHLWDDPLTYGGDELDQLVGPCVEHGFTTSGIPAAFDVERLYDRDLGSWAKSEARDSINAGTHWIAHNGHCNSAYCMRFMRSEIDDVAFTNDGVEANYAIVTSVGCYSGAFDNRSTYAYGDYDCVAEKMLSIEHFAVACLVNSRYGWFEEGTTNGPSHHLQREFFDAVFTEGLTTLGEANADSKDDTAPFIDPPGEYESGARRWCLYTLNLLGDPALDAWTAVPAPIAVTHPAAAGRWDAAVEIDTDAPGGTAVLWMDGVVYGRGIADGSGHVSIERSLPYPADLASLELTVRAHDRYAWRDTIAVDAATAAETPPLAVALLQNAPNPFNPSTVIRFDLPADGLVDLRAYDAAGREADRIVRAMFPAGRHAVHWRPDDLPSGVYFYVIRAAGVRIARKAVLLR